MLLVVPFPSVWWMCCLDFTSVGLVWGGSLERFHQVHQRVSLLITPPDLFRTFLTPIPLHPTPGLSLLRRVMLQMNYKPVHLSSKVRTLRSCPPLTASEKRDQFWILRVFSLHSWTCSQEEKLTKLVMSEQVDIVTSPAALISPQEKCE